MRTEGGRELEAWLAGGGGGRNRWVGDQEVGKNGGKDCERKPDEGRDKDYARQKKHHVQKARENNVAFSQTKVVQSVDKWNLSKTSAVK